VGLLLALVGVATAVGTLYLLVWSPLTVDQRIAASASSMTAGAFLIAVLAGIVALQAYRDAIRKPMLRLTKDVRGHEFASVILVLMNDGNGSAANVIVWIKLDDAQIFAYANWNREAAGGLRWESPSGVLIHPSVPYELPTLTIQKLSSDALTRLPYTVAADGFGPITGTV
jgi:hypothetical protein